MGLSMQQWEKACPILSKTHLPTGKLVTQSFMYVYPELSMHHKTRICIPCDWILVLLHSPDASIASTSYRLFEAAAFELLHLHTSISQNLLIFSLLSLSRHVAMAHIQSISAIF
jgi:hypothetical protein